MLFYQKPEFIKLLVNLIKECNDIVLKIYNTDFTIENKNDNSPLTIADIECNKHICNLLKQEFKDILIISEENKSIDYSTKNNGEYCWLIDPIDGTKEFIKKNGEFTINIGLCHKKIPVFGIVSIPVTGEIYYGAKGIGSYKLKNNLEIKLSINQDKNLNKKNIKIVGSSSHMNEDTNNFINLFNEPIIMSSGSSIKLLLIAEGKADIYPRLGLTSEWDTCAAHSIVKYSGGKVVQLNNKKITKIEEIYELNKEIEYIKKDILNPYFIVY